MAHDLPPAPAPSPTHALRRWRWPLASLLAVLLIGLAVLALSGPWRKAPAPDAPDAGGAFPLTPLSSSPYLNTRPEVGYVGSEACRSCHPDRHTSFRHTGMGRSMAPVDLAREPPDASFDHPPSKRRYQVRRKGGQLWHRELLLTSDPDEVLLAEYPLSHVVGSGRHSLTYVAEAEGFLVESPVTWYTSRKAWGMSPGYDNPHNIGFERAAGEGCLVCHAGRADALDGSLHRMRIVEPAIGCERCHGPGALHVERSKGPKRPARRPGEIDYTIVNPSHLSRELSEAVCQQCHLRSTATIVARGRNATDFRPGLPLQDFRQDYGLDVPGAGMTVVGHVEQMHLSKCYQKSKSLTCLTCHSPHDEPPPEKRVAYYRDACLTCHKKQGCKVAPSVRLEEAPGDNCIHCHMPSAPTEIPHLAFTHHRIGRHDRGREASKPGQPAEGRGTLRPFLDFARLGDIDRRRSLGLGYLEAANREKSPAGADHYRQRAADLLSRVKREGLSDPALDASLARLYFDLGRGGVASLARSALAHEGLVGQDRCNALYLLADAHVQEGRYDEARKELRQLVQLRRHSADWMLLAQAEHALGNPTAEEEALTRVVRISPRMWRVHQRLAERYRQRGDTERAAYHEKRAVP